MGKTAVAGDPMRASTTGGPPGRIARVGHVPHRREFPFFRPRRSLGRPPIARIGQWLRPNFLAANHFGQRCGLTSVERGEKRVPRTRGEVAVWPDRIWTNAQKDRHNLEFCDKARAISATLATFERHILADSSFSTTVCEPMSFFPGDFCNIDLFPRLNLKECSGRIDFLNRIGSKRKELSRPTRPAYTPIVVKSPVRGAVRGAPSLSPPCASDTRQWGIASCARNDLRCPEKSWAAGGARQRHDLRSEVG